MRSEPASGATVTERFPPRPSAAASAGVITSALSEDGDARPPAWATSWQSADTPGRLAISAPTRPIVLRSRRPRATLARSVPRLL